MRLIKKGATSQTLYCVILDSASTTGGRKTGIAWNTASLVGNYVRNGAARTAITLATLASASAAWSSGGFVEVDATNAPGLYRFDVPDAAFATGVDSVVVTLKGAAGMVGVEEEVQLTTLDLQDAVRMGMTALPNAAAEAAGGLYTRGSGAGQINQANNGNVDTNVLRVNGTTQTARDLGAQLDATVSSRLRESAIILRTGTLQAGATTTATLDAGASATTDFYKGQTIVFLTGTGSLQDALISTYNGGTKVATFADAIPTAPDNTTTFAILSTDLRRLLQLDAAITSRLASGNVTVGTNNDKTGYTVSTVSDKTGYSLSAAGVQAIWDALTSALTTVGSVGKLLVDNVNATISSRLASASYTAPDNTSIGTILTRTDVATSTRLATSGYTAPPSAATVSTQVWTEPIPGSFAAGSAGAKLNSASSAGDPWSTALPGAYGAGTGGNILGNLIASIWNAVAATYNAAGSMGQKLNAAGGAADPLTNTVPGVYAAGSAGYALGTLPWGVDSRLWTYTVTRTDNGVPIPGVTVYLTSDLAGNTPVYGPQITDNTGKVKFLVSAGTYYVWRQLVGYTFANPDQETVV